MEAIAALDGLLRAEPSSPRGYALDAPPPTNCAVCMVAPRQVALGCGHTACCEACTRLLASRGSACPVCRCADALSCVEPVVVS
jgi:hypothetical protein